MIESNLRKIHIFPNEESYKTNINSVGADDLSLVPFNGVPVGTIIAFAGNSIPSDYLLCNGGAISRTTYSRLFSIIGTTYGTGDGSTTFNLPNLTDKFIQGNAIAGTIKDAGLPNIAASTQDALYGAVKNATGALFFSNSPEANAFGSSGSKLYKMRLNFDASSSSTIYGNSETVQPPALTMRYIIKY